MSPVPVAVPGSVRLRMSSNRALAERFERTSKILELLGEDRFRVMAYERAARAVGDQSTDLRELCDDKKKLTAIDGIGAKMADKIIEYFSTGRIKELEEIAAKVPPGVVDLLGIQGLGPKTVLALWNQMGVTGIDDLKRVIEDGSILGLPRMGAKAVEKIRGAIELMEKSGERLTLGPAWEVAQDVLWNLEKVKGVKQVAFAGSLRRGRETVGDIDILASVGGGKTGEAAAKKAGEVFRSLARVERVIAAGETKSSVRMYVRAVDERWQGEEGGDGSAGGGGPTVQVDLRIVPEESWGAALLYFTGSKAHNVRLRERALKQKLTLNEYGLYPLDDEEEPPQKRGVKAVASRTEEEIYAKLGAPYIPPDIREDRGELDLTETPKLIELEDIKAELHAHTTASDGRLSILELAQAAKKRGFHTIAVTDHSKSSIVAGGLKPDELRRHIEAVHAAREQVKGIQILAGSEVDILTDGALDYDDELLALLDIVVASPHAALTQDEKHATRRLLRVIEHPLVDIVGHPTGRTMGHRTGLNPDIAELAAAAKEHNKALEINAHWMRLDLRDAHVRVAVETGALLAINCDVHAEKDFENLRFGVVTARRGWLGAEQCVNCWERKRLTEWLTTRRKHGWPAARTSRGA